MPKDFLDLVLIQEEDRFCAVGEIDGVMTFHGYGDSMSEAIGDFMITNREALGFKFGFIRDGEICLSTVYGRKRTKKQMGPNERKFLNGK